MCLLWLHRHHNNSGMCEEQATADKRAREAWRVQQFSTPHPAAVVHSAAAAGARTTSPQASPAAPDHERVVLHIDVDCFYAQVEEARNPSLRGKPLAVTQKYLCVTANYAARQAGVTK
jgi:DNA polymerase iota